MADIDWSDMPYCGMFKDYDSNGKPYFIAMFKGQDANAYLNIFSSNDLKGFTHPALERIKKEWEYAKEHPEAYQTDAENPDLIEKMGNSCTAVANAPLQILPAHLADNSRNHRRRG